MSSQKREREMTRQTERNWRREIPSVSVIVSCCQTLGNGREKQNEGEKWEGDRGEERIQ